MNPPWIDGPQWMDPDLPENRVMTGDEAMSVRKERTITDILKTFDDIDRGKTRYEGQPPTDWEVMVTEYRKTFLELAMAKAELKIFGNAIHNAIVLLQDDHPERVQRGVNCLKAYRETKL